MSPWTGKKAADQWSVAYIKTHVTGDWTQAIYTKLADKGKKNLVKSPATHTQKI